jgi:hypothetical protein
MAMSKEQLDFAREHGITYCPPGPTFDVSWTDPRRSRISGPTEIELLNRLRSGYRLRVIGRAAVPVSLKDGDLGRPRIRRGKGQRAQAMARQERVKFLLTRAALVR